LKRRQFCSHHSSEWNSVKGKAYSRTAKNFLYFSLISFAVLEYALPVTEFYQRIDENRVGGTTKIKRNLSSVEPLKKPTANENAYSIFESRHSRTKTIFEDRKKIPQKLENILFLQYFSPLPRREWDWQ
jgi:hypothetical protein